jgi:hypothetical protein
MWIFRVLIAAVILGSLSCGGAPSQPGTLSSTWVAPPLLAQVPADSPYLIASLVPVSDAVQQRIFAGLDEQLPRLLRMILEAEQKLNQGGGRRATDDSDGDDDSENDDALDLFGRDRGGAMSEMFAPWVRAAAVIAREVEGKKPTTWWRDLGFHPDGKFALYGLSLWPVLRLEVADPARLRGVIDRALAAGGVKPRQGTIDGRAYWTAGTDQLSMVAAVLEREAVIAMVPTASLAAALPEVLGTRAPAQSLGKTAKVPELLGRYGLMGYVFSYIETRGIVDIVTGRRTSEVDRPLRGWIGEVSPVCRGDLERLATAVPRLVAGYRRLDTTGFDTISLLELAPEVTSALKKLHTSAAEVTVPPPTGPLFSMGIAMTPEALTGWLRELAGGIRARPFACPWLADINKVGRELARAADKPLPALVRGVRGVSVTLDQATLSPPNFEGHVLLSGELSTDLVPMLSSMVPGMGGLPVKRDGRPVALPVAKLGIPSRGAHLAMNAERMVIASGPDSARDATARLAAPAPKSSPLLVMGFDGPRLHALIASIRDDGDDDDESTSHKNDTIDSLYSIKHVSQLGLSVDIVDQGISLAAWGTWAQAGAQK